MKFWQKTFLFTLALFLFFFGSGICVLAVYFGNHLTESCMDAGRSEQGYIARAFDADYEYTEFTGGDVTELMLSYSSHYSQDGITLVIEAGSHSNADTAGALGRIAAETALPDQEGSVCFLRRVNGVRYVFVKGALQDGTLTYIRDISYLDRQWKTVVWIFVGVGVGVAAVLAVALFWLTQRLTRPLKNLTENLAHVAEGDYSVRAVVNHRSRDEFSELAEGFNAMTERICGQISDLELATEQKQRLLDNLSHEMRTPLTSIHGYAEYLLHATVSEEERIDALQWILSESERLSKLSRTLLTISSVRNAELTRECVRLSDLFEPMAGRFGKVAEKEGVTLTIIPSSLAVSGDEELLTILLSNLIDNAIKACRDENPKGTEAEKEKEKAKAKAKEKTKEKTVTVSAQLHEENVILCVQDSGRGIAQEGLLHVTEPFYRTDKARSRADGGAGLGLSLCREIVAAHGGTLCFESRPGCGTTVTVTLPSDPAAVREDGEGLS